MFVEDTTESRLGQNPADPFPLCNMGVLHLSLSVTDSARYKLDVLNT